MLKINEEEIRMLESLAYLSTKPNSSEQFAQEIEAILNSVEQLGQVDTQGIEPLFHPLALNQRRRPDKITEENCEPVLKEAASLFEDHLYLVPKIIE